jgi:hypothetical protein
LIAAKLPPCSNTSEAVSVVRGLYELEHAMVVCVGDIEIAIAADRDATGIA